MLEVFLRLTQREFCPKDCMFSAYNKPKATKRKLKENNPPPRLVHWSISEVRLAHIHLIGSRGGSVRSVPAPALPCCLWRRRSERPATVHRKWLVSVTVKQTGLGGGT